MPIHCKHVLKCEICQCPIRGYHNFRFFPTPKETCIGNLYFRLPNGLAEISGHSSWEGGAGVWALMPVFLPCKCAMAYLAMHCLPYHALPCLVPSYHAMPWLAMQMCQRAKLSFECRVGQQLMCGGLPPCRLRRCIFQTLLLAGTNLLLPIFVITTFDFIVVVVLR